MKKSFMCSLICHNGIVGGALYLDENSVTYKTNKLTVDRAHRNLVLPLNEIENFKKHHPNAIRLYYTYSYERHGKVTNTLLDY